MAPGSMFVVLLALLRVLPVLLGAKTCRKFGLGAVLLELRPDSGERRRPGDRRAARRGGLPGK